MNDIKRLYRECVSKMVVAATAIRYEEAGICGPSPALVCTALTCFVLGNFSGNAKLLFGHKPGLLVHVCDSSPRREWFL